MITVNDNEPKKPSKKRVIKLKDVFIDNGKLMDDDGTNILAEIEKNIPKGVEYFSFSITFPLDED